MAISEENVKDKYIAILFRVLKSWNKKSNKKLQN